MVSDHAIRSSHRGAKRVYRAIGMTAVIGAAAAIAALSVSGWSRPVAASTTSVGPYPTAAPRSTPVATPKPPYTTIATPAPQATYTPAPPTIPESTPSPLPVSTPTVTVTSTPAPTPVPTPISIPVPADIPVAIPVPSDIPVIAPVAVVSQVQGTATVTPNTGTNLPIGLAGLLMLVGVAFLALGREETIAARR
jgi:hypothetical protein